MPQTQTQYTKEEMLAILEADVNGLPSAFAAYKEAIKNGNANMQREFELSVAFIVADMHRLGFETANCNRATRGAL